MNNLENISLVELSTEELVNIDGGKEGDAAYGVGYAVGKVTRWLSDAWDACYQWNGLEGHAM